MSRGDTHMPGTASSTGIAAVCFAHETLLSGDEPVTIVCGRERLN